MQTISFLQRYAWHAFMLTVAVVFVVCSVVNMLTVGISPKAYAFLESAWPRVAHLIDLSRALGAHFRQAGPALLGIITGRRLQAGTGEKALAALDEAAPLPATNPPEEPAQPPADTLEELIEKLRVATVDHPEGSRALPVLEALLLGRPSVTPPPPAPA